MDNMFLHEEEVIAEAKKNLENNRLETENDRLLYKNMLDEYKKLLKQMTLLIKISDLNQSELNFLSKKFKIASNIDELTGLYNRRYFNDICQREWSSAIRSKGGLAALMMDIDHFKSYNDIYGHLQGDKCLKLVADAIKSSFLRPRDMVARFGGEEFIAILPETDIEGAVYTARRILDNIHKLEIEHSGSPVYGKVTLSIGVAVITPSKNDTSSLLLNMADKALYRAKSDRRNCYSVFS